jgi:hypothetical protein
MRSQWQPASVVARLVDSPCADRYVFEHSLGADTATLTCCRPLFGAVRFFLMLRYTALLIRWTRAPLFVVSPPILVNGHAAWEHISDDPRPSAAITYIEAVEEWNCLHMTPQPR